MTGVIGSLRVNLGLDSAKFQSGAKRMDPALRRMQQQFRQISTVAAGMGTAIVAAAIAGARQIDEIAKSARRLDASIGGFRALELAASEAGVSLSSLTNDIQTMNRELASIGVSGNGSRAIAALGLSIKDLEGLDADEKLAVIADQVQALGLDAGQTTAILRDLGVRNREMALLVLQGGDAIRAARDDIRDYGLEISAVDASRIEAANDAIGRLGLITQYAGQQLALQFVPALGRMAEAMTDSLREGGFLRMAIDGLIAVLARLSSYVGTAVVLFGGRYVGALALAAAKTLTLSKALKVMTAALIRTGIGAVIVGAGELVYQFSRLVSATGGFGNALSAIVDVGIGVFQRMGSAALALMNVKRSITLEITSLFLSAFSTIAKAWDGLVNGMAVAWNSIADTSFGETLGLGRLGQSDVSGRLSDSAADFNARAIEAANAAGENFRNAREPIAAIQRLRDLMSQTNDTAAETVTINTDMATSFDDVSASGGGAAGAIQDVAGAADMAADSFANRLRGAVDSVVDAFSDWVARGFRDFKSMTDSIKMAFQQLLSDLIKQAVANPIRIALGLGGGGLGGGGGLLSGGLGLLSGVGGIAGLTTAFLGGAQFLGSGIAAGFASGGIAGAFSGGVSALGTAFAGASGGLGGLAAAAGAAVPVIGAVALAVAAFKKRTETLDKGLKVAIDGMDVVAQTFKKTRTSRVFGLVSRTSTSTRNDPDNPIIGAVADIQSTVTEAARVLGVGTEAFEDFSYRMRISLKGLNEEQRAAKIQEELAKMGDEFARLVPNVQNVNDLLQQANQIGERIRALTDNQGLFRSSVDAVFAASAAGRQTPLSALTITPDLLRELITAVREGDINNARLTSQLVAIQQRQELGLTA